MPVSLSLFIFWLIKNPLLFISLKSAKKTQHLYLDNKKKGFIDYSSITKSELSLLDKMILTAHLIKNEFN